ncbi:hypothetical protein LY78DRAFT_16631 [Colletotrichum sublineola]|nr:hypothetical protein LY78DRAFT_16631 [Colletotrichum sublineola]
MHRGTSPAATSRTATTAVEQPRLYILRFRWSLKILGAEAVGQKKTRYEVVSERGPPPPPRLVTLGCREAKRRAPSEVRRLPMHLDGGVRCCGKTRQAEKRGGATQAVCMCVCVCVCVSTCPTVYLTWTDIRTVHYLRRHYYVR